MKNNNNRTEKMIRLALGLLSKVKEHWAKQATATQTEDGAKRETAERRLTDTRFRTLINYL